MKKSNDFILAELNFLKDIIEKGFKEVHRRQDVTNGRISKHSEKIDQIEQDIIRVEEGYINKKDFQEHMSDFEVHKTEDLKARIEGGNKLKWIIVGGASTFVFGLLLNIIMKGLT